MLRFYREESGALLDVSVMSRENWRCAVQVAQGGSPRPACWHHAHHTQRPPPGPPPPCPPRCYRCPSFQKPAPKLPNHASGRAAGAGCAAYSGRCASGGGTRPPAPHGTQVGGLCWLRCCLCKWRWQADPLRCNWRTGRLQRGSLPTPFQRLACLQQHPMTCLPGQQPGARGGLGPAGARGAGPD